MLGPGEIFTIFFVMLGPIKLLGPFATLTRDVEDAKRRRVAVRAFVIATAGVLVGGFLGVRLLAEWLVSIPAIMLAAGLVFLLVALRMVLEPYEPRPSALPAPPPDTRPSTERGLALRIAFPTVVTPYGMAAVIVLLAASDDPSRTMTIVGLVLAVLVLDLLAMLFARQILRTIGTAPLQILGAVLGVLQVALAVQILIASLRLLGVLPPAPR